MFTVRYEPSSSYKISASLSLERLATLSFATILYNVCDMWIKIK